MNDDVFFSPESELLDWKASRALRFIHGPKGAALAALPRKWTPPFILLPAKSSPEQQIAALKQACERYSSDILTQVADNELQLIIRSSVLGETIWDRGTYDTVILSVGEHLQPRYLLEAINRVHKSANGREVAIVLQRYIRPLAFGNFGNLLRVSQERDNFEISMGPIRNARPVGRLVSTSRRSAASPQDSLSVRSASDLPRLLATVGAYCNGTLLRGETKRCNIEWIQHFENVYLVQIDVEDEDVHGLNPFHLAVEPAPSVLAADGRFFGRPALTDFAEWDKLAVLHELWLQSDAKRPTLLFAPFTRFRPSSRISSRALEAEIDESLGAKNIIVRISGRRDGREKPLNLPRTDCVSAGEAARWCLEQVQNFRARGDKVEDFAFVAHRFIASRASAWVSASPCSSWVEIHGLWGLPDALQYCPHDTWEFHVPSGRVYDYARYKSNMLARDDNGKWIYERVKNEIGWDLAISRNAVREIAQQTFEIAMKLGDACNVMWFVDCVDQQGAKFSIPWYWVKPVESSREQTHRSLHKFRVRNRVDLTGITASEDKQIALEIYPDVEFIRDNKFLEDVAALAADKNWPVILHGSTLAHAYYILRRHGCFVLTPSLKSFSRFRHVESFGKMVRDKIPERISSRDELSFVQEIPPSLYARFLVGKLVEEGFEYLFASAERDKGLELADVFEVVLSLAAYSKLSMERIREIANEKRAKSGGFDKGYVLWNTAMGSVDRDSLPAGPERQAQQFVRVNPDGALEIPFAALGLLAGGAARTVYVPEIGSIVRFQVEADRILFFFEIGAEQIDMFAQE